MVDQQVLLCYRSHKMGEIIKRIKGLYIWKTSKNEKVRATAENVIKGGKMDMAFFCVC